MGGTHSNIRNMMTSKSMLNKPFASSKHEGYDGWREYPNGEEIFPIHI